MVIELTHPSGTKVWINIDNVRLFYVEDDNGTTIEFNTSNSIEVVVSETPQQIAALIYRARRQEVDVVGMVQPS